MDSRMNYPCERMLNFDLATFTPDPKFSERRL
jgi:hypothetical protein